MGWSFSAASKEKLENLHPAIRAVLHRALELSPVDFTIIYTHRTEDQQNAAVAGGFSKTPWPKSRHNSLPSEAVDVAPLHPEGKIDWQDNHAFTLLAGVILASAKLLGVKLRYGGDWDSDGNLREESFRDLGHFELVKE